MSRESVEVVHEMFAAWNRRDYGAAQAAFHPKVEVEVSAESVLDGIYRGYSGLGDLMRFWGAFADFHSHPEETLTAGHEVFTTVRHYGRGKTSGVDVQMENWQVFTVREGTIVRYRVFGSREAALEAAGLSE